MLRVIASIHPNDDVKILWRMWSRLQIRDRSLKRRFESILLSGLDLRPPTLSLELSGSDVGPTILSLHYIAYYSCKYPSSRRSKLSRFVLEFSRPLRASVGSFISIHQVAAATALLLLLILLMRAWFMVIRQVSLA